jgi:hypothetical protein
VTIETFRNFKKFIVFKSRNVQAESLNDDFDQLFSSSFSSSLVKISSISKKKFHRRFISLQSILLSYKEKELESRESSRIVQKSERTTTTSFNDSSISASSSRVREETVDEKISRMNQITKVDLQEMLNVIVIASIVVVAAIISQFSASSRTVSEQFASANRSSER